SSAKVQTTNFAWNPDGSGAQQGSARKLLSQTVVLQGRNEDSTSFAYDNYGNLLSETVTARDVGADAIWPPSNRASTVLPPATYGYSSDGYFRTSETHNLSNLPAPVSTRTIAPN